MNIKKIIILFVGFVLPIGIFLFLKIFGENKFEVAPLFQSELPVINTDCPSIKAPYKVPDEITGIFVSQGNELGLVAVVDSKGELPTRLMEEFANDPIVINEIENSTSMFGLKLSECVFLLNDSYDMVLVDKFGIIRGQYDSGDRDELDRLIMEVAIILGN